METKGNYVLVGLFAMVVMAASFAYFYWSGRYDAGRQQGEVVLLVRGSANGLAPGSSVLFNGIWAGQVTELRADEFDPNLVRLVARVATDLPIKIDTKASVGSQGITGISVVFLDGGTIKAPRLLQEDATERPVLETKSPENIVAQAQQLTGSAESILTDVNKIVGANKDNINAIISNTRKFSDALASNSDDLENLLKSAGEVANSLGDLSNTLKPAAGRLEQLLASVEPARVGEITKNVELFSKQVADASGKIDSILKDAQQATKGLTTFSDKLVGVTDQADAFISKINPDELAAAVESVYGAIEGVAQFTKGIAPLGATLGDRSKDIDKIIADATSVVANVKSGTENLSELTASLTGAGKSVTKASDNISSITGDAGKALDGAAKLFDSIKPEDIEKAITSVQAAAASAEKTVKSFEPLGEVATKRADDLDAMVVDLRETLANVRGASVRVSGLFDSADSLLNSEGTNGLISEATSAARSLRRLTDMLETRGNSIATGLDNFTDRGLRDLQQLIVQTQKAVQSFEQMTNSLESNPQRVIFGGSDVKEFGGRQRR